MAGDTVVENAETALESAEAEEDAAVACGGDAVVSAEAAVASLKSVKETLRRLDCEEEELSDYDKAGLSDAMEEVLAQYGKVQGLYKSAKERLLDTTKLVGASLALIAVAAGFIKFFP